MNLILLGAPGAGKGTQAEVICNKLKIPSVSTGNLIREAVKNGTELGRKVKKYMDAGQLVPDEVVIEIVKKRLLSKDCENGFIFDGFPRTLPQAEELNCMGVVIDKVIDIEVSEDAIIKRLSGRRVCENCGASYHVDFKPTDIKGICDVCGGKTVQRRDDHPDTVRARLQVYHEQTEPLKKYYAEQHKLYVVEGQEEIKDTTALILKSLEA